MPVVPWAVAVTPSGGVRVSLPVELLSHAAAAPANRAATAKDSAFRVFEFIGSIVQRLYDGQAATTGRSPAVAAFRSFGCNAFVTLYGWASRRDAEVTENGLRGGR